MKLCPVPVIVAAVSYLWNDDHAVPKAGPPSWPPLLR